MAWMGGRTGSQLMQEEGDRCADEAPREPLSNHRGGRVHAEDGLGGPDALGESIFGELRRTREMEGRSFNRVQLLEWRLTCEVWLVRDMYLCTLQGWPSAL